MSDLNKWAEENLWPKVWENANQVFPEFDFKRNGNHWVSQTGLKIDGSIGEKGKVYIYKDRPYYLKDYTRDGISITTYLKEKSEADSWIGSLKYLADKVGIHFPKSNIHKEIEMSKNKKESLSVKEARETWENSKPIEGHAYLTKKRIRPHGIREYKNELVIPMCYKDEISSLQFIKENGDKKFLSGGKTAGCYFIIGNLEGAKKICIAEGWATGASIHQATNLPVYIAFNCGNLESVSQYVREQYPDREIIICADDDFKTEGNSGKLKATIAARIINAKLAIPHFDENRPDKATDFNDMGNLLGLDNVALTITKAKLPWPQPQHLVEDIAEERNPYPLEALPDTVKNAVKEVIDYVQAPIPLAASSALGALSLAIQGHIDIKRDNKLSGPCGLFLLTIAESGERKSTSDGYFTKAIREYEKKQSTERKSALRKYLFNTESWKSKFQGIKENIKSLTKNGEKTTDEERRLLNLMAEKPSMKQTPRLLYDDTTPEALREKLATWPIGGILSSEAGIVFGSYAMNKDSIQRNLSTCNIFWDGGNISIDRKTSDSFVVRNARLTLSLQAQPVIIKKFIRESRGLTRDIGFLARFLISWPKSTQGERLHREAPSNWPSLEKFNKKLCEILERPLKFDVDEVLSPTLLYFSPKAKNAWIKFHDEIERGLKKSRDFSDIVSRLADQVARLAALFHFFEHGLDSPVDVESVNRAVKIVHWYFTEAKHFLKTLELSQEQRDIIALNDWLIEKCREKGISTIERRKAQQCGPVRKSGALDTALEKLRDLGRIYQDKGKIIVNPTLLQK